MKKPWTAKDWCIIILALTIFTSVMSIPVQRLLGGAPLSDNATAVISSVLTLIGGGLISILSRQTNQKSEEDDNLKT